MFEEIYRLKQPGYIHFVRRVASLKTLSSPRKSPVKWSCQFAFSFYITSCSVKLAKLRMKTVLVWLYLRHM